MKKISAQVILKPKAGQMPAAESITAKNLESFMPDANLAATTRAHFESLGFEIGELVANSFSITASRKTFEQHFHAKIEVTEQHTALKGGNLELPISTLPKDVRSSITAVSFSAPPDFGPGNF